MKLIRIMQAIGSGNAKGHFGQHAEDVLVRKLFDRKKRDGKYLDLGAYHPFRFSNTAYFWLKGWSGVNVDANPQSIKLFDAARPADVNICAALVEQKALDQGLTHIQLMLPSHRDTRTGVSATGTVDASLAAEHNQAEGISVPATSVNQILRAYDLRTVDYLNVDIEGYDERIICEFDFDFCRPQVITIEDFAHDLTELAATPITQHLRAQGYALVARAGSASVFLLR